MRCPKCGTVIHTDKTYSADFLRFWAAYDAPKRTPSASKSDAFKAWQQIEEKRPGIESLLVAVRKYRSHIDSSKGITCHPSTWLRQGRFESFLPTDAISASSTGPTAPAAQQVNSSWPGEVVVSLSALIGPGKFQTWLASSEFVPSPAMGEPVVIRVKSALSRDWIAQKFGAALFRTIGAFEIVVVSDSGVR